MSAHQTPLTATDKIERQLARLLAADKRQRKNENTVRRAKNGDLIYETVRTSLGEPASGRPDSDAAITAASKIALTPADPNYLPNNLPQTPVKYENGNLIGDSAPISSSPDATSVAAETTAAVALVAGNAVDATTQQPSSDTALTCHEAENPGNQQPADPLTELLHRALAATKTRRGHPPAFDDHSRGQLVALLSVGMSMRQAASVLGVSHTTVQNTLKADPALAESITAARFQAQLQPLACVIREARRSWKAATWLLKYLDTKIASHEETPDERQQRQQRETDEFFAHARRRR